MKAWLFQDHRQKQRLGDRCPWSVGWVDPDGKRRSKRIGSKSRAEKFARKTEGQLAAGSYDNLSRATWADLEAEYASKVMAVMRPGSRESSKYALKHFRRIIKPVRMQGITSRTLAEYVAKRRAEPRHRRRKLDPGEPVELISPATVNKELRGLRAVIRKAQRWGYLPKTRDFEYPFLKEPQRLPTYVPPDHFVTLYDGCRHARLPNELPYAAADWWRGLLVMAYMTGWRIGSLLALRRADVNFDAGTALSRAEDNKGGRDQLVPLHPLVIEHLRKLACFHIHIFPWMYNRRRLFLELARVQLKARVKPTGGKHHYTFHDLRRGFATMNADKLTPDALQALMQHRDYQTTQRYINMARQLNPAVADLYVPDLKKSGAGR